MAEGIELESQLIQIVDAAMAEAARLAGSWLACRPGCFECCLGPFAITELDARRLRAGMGALWARDAARAERVGSRAKAWTGGEDEACPALDRDTGTCDLYAYRPITCRTFGPPVRCGSGAVGVCELCFVGASDEEIAACEVVVDEEGLEARLLAGLPGETTVAEAILSVQALG